MARAGPGDDAVNPTLAQFRRFTAVVEAARALGAFAERLAPMVRLQPA